MKSILKRLNIHLPKHDKLKHYFVGSLIFLALSVLFSNLIALLLTAIVAIGWEFWQKKQGGKNTKKEMILDVCFSVLLAIIITLKEWVL